MEYLVAFIGHTSPLGMTPKINFREFLRDCREQTRIL